jgi:hypothetical protein
MMLIPAPPAAPPNFGTIRIVIVAIYGAFGLLGVLWLYYFNRRAIRDAFGGISDVENGGRPLSISIIGWGLLVSGIFAVLVAPFRLPGSILIWIFTGWAAALWYLLYGGLFVYVGYGLLRLQPVARTTAIVVLCYGAVNGLVFFLSPGADARLATFMSHYSFGSQVPPPFRLPGIVYGITAAVSAGVPLWFLITRESAFRSASLPLPSRSE